MAGESIRTTLALPAEVLHQVDEAVRAGKARSRNAFVVQALRRELALREREEIDAAFAAMKDDIEVQREAEQLAREFARADWEALREARA